MAAGPLLHRARPFQNKMVDIGDFQSTTGEAEHESAKWAHNPNL